LENCANCRLSGKTASPRGHRRKAKYPVSIEQCYAILCALPGLASGLGLNLDTLTVAGDSVGGNMATVMTLMCKYHGGPKIHKQLMYYPVTNAYFETPTYIQFATNYYLLRERLKRCVRADRAIL